MLADNEDQNDLMGTSRANAASLLPVHARQIKDLVDERGLNRELEALPSEKEIRAAHRGRHRADLTGTRDADGAREAGAQGRSAGHRAARSGGVRRPAARVLPDPAAGPVRARDPHRTSCAARSSPRCWSTTWSTPAGICYAYRIIEDVGVGPVDAVRTYVATDAIFGIGEVWRRDPRGRMLPVARVGSDDAGPAPADRPRRTLAAQLPAAAAGGRRRDQPVRREGGRR